MGEMSEFQRYKTFHHIIYCQASSPINSIYESQCIYHGLCLYVSMSSSICSLESSAMVLKQHPSAFAHTSCCAGCRGLGEKDMTWM